MKLNENFDNFGVMLECSRNAVPNIDFLKTYVDDLAKMGYNQLQLYTEDTYEIDGEPFFGYLRGRFTKEELKEISAYGKKRGVEIVPCIQTLGHMNCVVRWEAYNDVTDCRNTLLIGEEKTYALIDKMIATMRECFDTELIHIGMDEAAFAGLGKYLHKNGYKNRFDLLCEHLKRVVAIVKKYNFKPIMWSDMWFSLANDGVYRKKDAFDFPEDLFGKVPEEAALCYWDYYSKESDIVDNMLKEHNRFKNEIWFAGGCWSWGGFTPSNFSSMEANVIGINSCIKHGVKNVLMTIWGDDGHETSKLANYPSLFHAVCLAKGITDVSIMNKNFEELFGISMEDCLKLDSANEIQKINSLQDFNGACADNPSNYMFYSDPFMGIFDKTVTKFGSPRLARHAKELKKFVDNEKFGYVFDVQQKLCEIMAIKYSLGVKTRKAYLENDIEAIKKLIQKYKLLIKKIPKFHEALKKQWFIENKPHGFEIQDARLGGVIMRLTTCSKRLQDFVDGKIKKIEELEEVILTPFTWRKDEQTVYYHDYVKTVSTSVMAFPELH